MTLGEHERGPAEVFPLVITILAELARCQAPRKSDPVPVLASQSAVRVTVRGNGMDVNSDLSKAKGRHVG
jgi:hypothetical protein